MNDAPSLNTRAILLLTAPLIFGREPAVQAVFSQASRRRRVQPPRAQAQGVGAPARRPVG